MVLVYMVSWIPSIYPIHVSIYSSTMDPSWDGFVVHWLMFLLRGLDSLWVLKDIARKVDGMRFNFRMLPWVAMCGMWPSLLKRCGSRWVLWKHPEGLGCLENWQVDCWKMLTTGSEKWMMDATSTKVLQVSGFHMISPVMWLGGFVASPFHLYNTHRIHGAGIYANIGGILMVNVTIYSIHGSYGIYNPFPLIIQDKNPWKKKQARLDPASELDRFIYFFGAHVVTQPICEPWCWNIYQHLP